ncbi:MAG: class I adenylate-forming enzyme family protein [Oscillospiraceae bacterium]
MNEANIKLKEDLNNFKNVFESEYTWIAGFMRNVYRYPDKKAMIFPLTGEEWTYAQFNSVVNKFSNALLNDGVEKGDVIMYNLTNCPVFAFAYVTAHKIGAVNAPINFRLSAGEIALTIDDSQPKVFIFESDKQELMSQALEIAEHKPDIIIMTDVYKKTGSTDKYKTFEDYIRNFSESEPELSFEHNIYDETTRFYTSGTTGKPKGVPLTSINEVLSSHDVIIHFPLDHRDVTMNMTPWFHRGGLHCAGPAPTLYVGGTMVVMKKFEPKVCLDFVEKYKLTFLIGVPAVLESLTVEQEKNPKDISTLRGIVTMGSPLERAACIKFQQVLTPNIFNGYGTTETFWNTFLRPFDLPDMAGTAGRSCLDDEVKVVKSYPDKRAEPDDEAERDNKEVGEVIIRCSAKSSYCYYNNDEETKKKFYKGYYYTNDLGTWDENQFVSIVGRKDDMIISAGENIYPTQVEEILNSCDGVEDCIVTSVPDEARGEVVTALIVRNDESITADQIDKYCKENPMLANYKRPRYYKFVNQIPRNATGKKLNVKAKEIAREDLQSGNLIKV